VVNRCGWRKKKQKQQKDYCCRYVPSFLSSGLNNSRLMQMMFNKVDYVEASAVDNNKEKLAT